VKATRRGAKLVRFDPVGLALAEPKALELSSGGFGEFVKKLDPAGALVATNAFCDKLLKFAG
jgi:hypothetical protein